MAGYNGFSKSNNAIEAESCGRYPLVKAAQVIAANYNVTIKNAKEWLEQRGTHEYHHTSKMYNVVNYYDTNLDDDQIEDLRSFVAPVSSFKPKVFENQIINWLEWGGTRKHPRAVCRTGIGTVEIISERTARVKLASGHVFDKRLDCKGFSFHNKED